jgi:hypothetical protein
MLNGSPQLLRLIPFVNPNFNDNLLKLKEKGLLLFRATL